MTIEEVRELQQETERRIGILLKEFRRNTTLRVHKVILHSENLEGDSLVTLCISW